MNQTIFPLHPLLATWLDEGGSVAALIGPSASGKTAQLRSMKHRYSDLKESDPLAIAVMYYSPLTHKGVTLEQDSDSLPDEDRFRIAFAPIDLGGKILLLNDPCQLMRINKCITLTQLAQFFQVMACAHRCRIAFTAIPPCRGAIEYPKKISCYEFSRHEGEYRVSLSQWGET